jgi:ribosomal protein S18 acetylase RimI-like enzyme
MSGDVDVRSAVGDEGWVGDHRVREGTLAAFIDGSLCGVAEFHTLFYGHAFIALLLVDERFRRRGVASALISACANAAPTNKLFVSTNTSNLAAQALFLHLGFRPSGSIDNLDEGDPELVYCKLLEGREPPLH